MRRFLFALSILVLAGCASQPPLEQAPSGVEDRRPADTAAAQKPGAQTQPVDRAPIASVDLTKKPSASAGGGPLTNPDSILSRRSVFFDYDRFDVRDEFKPMMEAHAKWLRDNNAERMLIQGNTDERGSREYNLALGQKRADSMKRMLTLLGAKEEQVEAVSLGEEKPRDASQSEQAFAQNRRGDILYKSVREF